MNIRKFKKLVWLIVGGLALGGLLLLVVLAPQRPYSSLRRLCAQEHSEPFEVTRTQKIFDFKVPAKTVWEALPHTGSDSKYPDSYAFVRLTNGKIAEFMRFDDSDGKGMSDGITSEVRVFDEPAPTPQLTWFESIAESVKQRLGL